MERPTLATVTPDRPLSLRHQLYQEHEQNEVEREQEEARIRQEKRSQDMKELRTRIGALLDLMPTNLDAFITAHNQYSDGPAEVVIDGITFALPPDPNPGGVAVWLRAEQSGLNIHRTVFTRADLARAVHDADERFPYRRPPREDAQCSSSSAATTSTPTTST